jgi:hypothetical protein
MFTKTYSGQTQGTRSNRPVFLHFARRTIPSGYAVATASIVNPISGEDEAAIADSTTGPCAHAATCLALPCPALSCPALPCLALPCVALPGCLSDIWLSFNQHDQITRRIFSAAFVSNRRSHASTAPTAPGTPPARPGRRRAQVQRETALLLLSSSTLLSHANVFVPSLSRQTIVLHVQALKDSLTLRCSHAAGHSGSVQTTYCGEKTALFSPFIYKNQHFTKTGSGRT